jgi:hypothetical protein
MTESCRSGGIERGQLDDGHRQLIVPLRLDHLHDPQCAAGACGIRACAQSVEAS